MCLAIRLKKEFTLDEVSTVIDGIENAWSDNPDGAGMSYVENGELVIDKGYFDKESFKARVTTVLTDSLPSDVLIHLRYASAGVVGEDNCHPFKVNDNMTMMHNGTITQMDSSVTDSDSDTLKFAKFLSELPENFDSNYAYDVLIENFLGANKIVLLNKDGESKVYNGDQGETIGNIWFSNDYYKPNIVREIVGNFSRKVDTSKKETKKSGNTKKVKVSKDYYYKDECMCCGNMLETKDEEFYGICSVCMVTR